MAESCTINAEIHVTIEMTTTIFCSDIYGLQSRSVSFLIMLHISSYIHGQHVQTILPCPDWKSNAG